MASDTPKAENGWPTPMVAQKARKVSEKELAF
jgi:hypothetical protein